MLSHEITKCSHFRVHKSYGDRLVKSNVVKMMAFPRGKLHKPTFSTLYPHSRCLREGKSSCRRWSKQGRCCWTHPLSLRHELLPRAILQETSAIPLKLISESNTIISESYPENHPGVHNMREPCHEQTHTAGTRNQPWTLAFQGESSWCQAALGGRTITSDITPGS